VQSLPRRERQPLKNKFKNADPQGKPDEGFASFTTYAYSSFQAIELLERMLVFDPRKRVKAGEALEDTYLSPYHDPTDEPEAEEKFDWSFNDADLPVDTWKIMMYVKFSRVCNSRQNVSGANDITGRYSEILDYHNVDFHQ
jgi:p38 MAP kinase